MRRCQQCDDCHRRESTPLTHFYVVVPMPVPVPLPMPVPVPVPVLVPAPVPVPVPVTVPVLVPVLVSERLAAACTAPALRGTI